MREFLKIFEIAAPYNFVLFDHNPEQLKITRTAKNMGTSLGRSTGGGNTGSGGNAGSTGVVNRGNEPTKMTITKARLVGPECKPMCDRLLKWLSPRDLQPIEMAVAGLMGGFITPILLVQWGPPLMGFTFQAQLTSVTIDYLRVSALGIPTHATALLQLQEYPQVVSLTNPTSGGRPGRNRHMVTAHETLASIANATFGNPNAWRAIADINNIDDPTSIRPGDIVYLPAPEELAELTGAHR